MPLFYQSVTEGMQKVLEFVYLSLELMPLVCVTHTEPLGRQLYDLL